MDVSIIIINYNTPQLVNDCIESIRKHTQNISYEIIVVDNASNKESRRLISSIMDITYIYSDVNLGFGKANNLGSTYAKGKYLLFLNSDTILYKNSIRDLWYFCENHKWKIGAVGLQLVDKTGQYMHSCGFFPSIIGELKGSHNNCNLPIQNDYQVVDYITGADLFISKQTFQNIGGFDKDFFMYYEETDLQRRLVDKNYSNYLLNNNGIVHLEGGSFESGLKKTPINRLQMQLESRLLYMKKHLSKKTYICFRVLYFLRALPSVFIFKCKVKSKIKYIKTLL